jgi:GNAT superfamily N-acetyltransferase
MTPTTRIRPATRADLPALAAVLHDAWHDGHRGLIPDELAAARGPAYVATWAEELLHRAVVDVADTGTDTGGRLVGLAVVRDDELHQLMVTRDARGSAVAVDLLAAAEDRVRAAGHPRAWLTVLEGNERARRFYDRHGWADDGAEDVTAFLPGGRTTTLVVRRCSKDVGTKDVGATARP